MAKLNPTVIVLMIFGFSTGYYINGMSGAMLGLAVTSGISWLVSIFLTE